MMLIYDGRLCKHGQGKMSEQANRLKKDGKLLSSEFSDRIAMTSWWSSGSGQKRIVLFGKVSLEEM